MAPATPDRLSRFVNSAYQAVGRPTPRRTLIRYDFLE
jgi:hypothetical protein